MEHHESIMLILPWWLFIIVCKILQSEYKRKQQENGKNQQLAVLERWESKQLQIENNLLL
jgi:hypothetical protein